MIDSLYGIFGGTFDPVHNGHLQTVLEVVQKCGLERVLFVPSAIPPHKNTPHASASERLEMVRLAISSYRNFELDDRELQRDAPSYTLETIKSLNQDYPDRKFCFILGIDAMLGLENWYQWQELLSCMHFIVMQRPGWARAEDLPEWWHKRLATSLSDLKNSQGGKIFETHVKPVAVSATEIRFSIAQDIDVSGMMPEPVWEYIQKNNLYQK